ncbi:hypothetical protein ACLOJK_004291 [Asimina triloba]
MDRADLPWTLNGVAAGMDVVECCRGRAELTEVERLLDRAGYLARDRVGAWIVVGDGAAGASPPDLRVGAISVRIVLPACDGFGRRLDERTTPAVRWRRRDLLVTSGSGCGRRDGRLRLAVGGFAGKPIAGNHGCRLEEDDGAPNSVLRRCTEVCVHAL